MTIPDEMEKVFKRWKSLKCPHCGKLNPRDVVRCIYCNHIIGRSPNPELQPKRN